MKFITSTLRRVAALATCTLVAVPAIVFAAGVYAPTGRSNDPFVFCTYGVPADGWIAINPILGTWTATRQYPNLFWVPTYEAICPAAMKQGAWTGPGTGAQVPFPH